MTEADSSLAAALCNTSQCCVYHPGVLGETSCPVLYWIDTKGQEKECALRNINLRMLIWPKPKQTKRCKKKEKKKNTTAAGCGFSHRLTLCEQVSRQSVSWLEEVSRDWCARWTVRVLG